MHQRPIILVQTIGDVTGYKRVIYVDPGGGDGIETFMTLGYFTKRFDVRKLVIIGLESALTVSRTIRKNDKHLYAHVLECLNKLNNSIVHAEVSENGGSISVKVLPRNVVGYGEWVDLVKQYYDCFIRHELVNYTGDISYIVLPMKARDIQGYNYELSNVQLYKALLLYGLYTLVKEALSKVKDNVDIVLDVTHGLNYITATTVDAIRMLVPIFRRNVEIWNAIPLDANTFEMQYIYKLLAARAVIDLSVDSSKLSDRKKVFIEALRRNGVLAIQYLCRNRENMVNYYEEWIRQRMVDHRSIKGEFKHSPEEVYVDIIYEHVCENVGSNMLTDMQRWGPRVFEITSSSSGRIVEKELNDIYSNYMHKLAPGQSCVYGGIDEVYKSYGVDKRGDVERNFIAHAGLLYGIVKLTKSNDDLSIDYCRERKDLLDMVISGLSEIIGEHMAECGPVQQCGK